MIIVIRCNHTHDVHSFVMNTLEPLSPSILYSREGRRYIVHVAENHDHFLSMCDDFAQDNAINSFEVLRSTNELRTGDKARLKKKNLYD